MVFFNVRSKAKVTLLSGDDEGSDNARNDRACFSGTILLDSRAGPVYLADSLARWLGIQDALADAACRSYNTGICHSANSRYLANPKWESLYRDRCNGGWRLADMEAA